MSLKHAIYMSKMRALEAAKVATKNLDKKLDEMAEKNTAKKDQKKRIAPKGMRRHRLPQ